MYVHMHIYVYIYVYIYMCACTKWVDKEDLESGNRIQRWAHLEHMYRRRWNRRSFRRDGNNVVSGRSPRIRTCCGKAKFDWKWCTKIWVLREWEQSRNPMSPSRSTLWRRRAGPVYGNHLIPPTFAAKSIMIRMERRGAIHESHMLQATPKRRVTVHQGTSDAGRWRQQRPHHCQTRRGCSFASETWNSARWIH